ncbi:hypothetical protein MMC34_002445 [Xylographa carneopallida]|nr:hypothetical protein [Xylographa carneopallida]
MSPTILDLSAELTQEVMKYLFGYQHTIHIAHGTDTEYTLGPILSDAVPPLESLQPAVLRACSQLRDSGTTILYGHHTFEFLGVEPFRWFVARTDTAKIRHLRFFLDMELTDTIDWIRCWKSRAFRDGFPQLRSVEIDTPYGPLTEDCKRWFDVRLDIACEELQRHVSEGCKVVKKYL